jgi:hypothetical protein
VCENTDVGCSPCLYTCVPANYACRCVAGAGEKYLQVVISGIYMLQFRPGECLGQYQYCTICLGRSKNNREMNTTDQSAGYRICQSGFGMNL